MHQVQAGKLIVIIQSHKLESDRLIALDISDQIRRRRIGLANATRNDLQSGGRTEVVESSQFVVAFPVDRVC